MNMTKEITDYKTETQAWFKHLQDHICKAIEDTDGGAVFKQDVWEHVTGGGGRTRIIQNGNILAKAGVNFSAVWGSAHEKMLQALHLQPGNYFATGVSIVMHPISPMVPIIHMNVRYFEMDNGTYWFGGGIDLTPHYVNKEDAVWFHTQLKKVCDSFNAQYYPKFKAWADDYFYIKHRQETRGIGGIFFDHLKADENTSKQQIWEFVKAVGESFAAIYTKLMAKNSALPYGDNELMWQALRRGRYVEFNLVYDKGTKFGLDTQGRTESILMSMPPMAEWAYCHTPTAGTPEAETLAWLKKGIDWV